MPVGLLDILQINDLCSSVVPPNRALMLLLVSKRVRLLLSKATSSWTVKLCFPFNGTGDFILRKILMQIPRSRSIDLKVACPDIFVSFPHLFYLSLNIY